MKLFRTPLKADVSEHTINLKDKILTAGSCFADAIATRLHAYKFSVCRNPFGTIYNPHSLHKALTYALYNEIPPEHTYLQNSDVHLNYDFHSSFSSLSKDELTRNVKETIGSVHYFLKDAPRLIITYGTAWVYERQDTGELVANCHKMPGNLFKKSLLTQKKIIESFDTFYRDLIRINPAIRITLTVSPVRHIKDTLELNAVSKSLLRVTCHSLTESYDNTDYFPAYEIMMDDLRDYRFYKSDMIHPTEEAEDYIWERFIEKYFDPESAVFVEKWKKILSALHHRPFQPSSQSNRLFLLDTLKKLEELKSTVNVSEEVSRIKAQLA